MTRFMVTTLSIALALSVALTVAVFVLAPVQAAEEPEKSEWNWTKVPAPCGKMSAIRSIAIDGPRLAVACSGGNIHLTEIPPYPGGKPRSGQ